MGSKFFILFLLQILVTNVFGQISDCFKQIENTSPKHTDKTISVCGRGSYFVEFNEQLYIHKITLDRTLDSNIVVQSFVEGRFVTIPLCMEPQTEQVYYVNRRTMYLKIFVYTDEEINILFNF